MRCAEGYLLGLTEEFVDVAVEDKFPYFADWDKVLGPYFGGVQNIEFELVLVTVGDALNSKFPLRIGSSLDGFVEIPSMEVRILATQL